MKEDLTEQFKSIYNIDLDFSEFDDTPESMAKFQEKLMEEMAKKLENDESFFDKKNEAKKGSSKEAIKTNAEVQKLKSIRNIYVSLAKLLHPDTETDLTEKIKKEELMKKVTKAYNEKDLATLLKLELQWVSNSTSNLNKLTDDKLNLYISALKEQLIELEKQLFEIRNHPRYDDISEWSLASLKTGIEGIRDEGDFHKTEINTIEKDLKMMETKPDKNLIISRVEELHDLYNDDDKLFEDFLDYYFQ